MTANANLPHSSKRPASRAGLSLVEVLITVAVIGILAGVLIPQMQADVPDRLIAAGQIVAADLEYARSLAVVNNSTYRVTFEPDENGYSLEHSGANVLLEPLPPSPFHQSAAAADRQTTSLDDLPIGKPNAQIVGALTAAGGAEVQDVDFAATGGTTRGDSTLVWLACGHGEGRRFLPVSIHATTGLVEVGEVTAELPDALDDVETSP